jgi:hypothetical protein
VWKGSLPVSAILSYHTPNLEETLVGTLVGFENNNTTQYCKLRASPAVLSKIG